MSELTTINALRESLWQRGWRPVPIYSWDHADRERAGKAPLGNRWHLGAQANPPSCIDLGAVPHATNTGILCSGLRVIDVDVDDPMLVGSIIALTKVHLGSGCLRRIRANSPRTAVLYAAVDPSAKKKTVAGPAHQKVEVLGDGQQLVAFGRHPSGAELEWLDGSPLDVAPAALGKVTEAQVDAFLAAVAPLLGAPPYTPRKGGNGAAAPDRQHSLAEVAAAMRVIPNDGPADWEHWNSVGLALWDATGGSAAGGELWDEWSSRNASYDADTTAARWAHFAVSPPTRTGAGKLFAMAAAVIRPPSWNGIDQEPPELLPELQVLKKDLPFTARMLRDSLTRHEWLFERGGPATCYPPETGNIPEIHVLTADGVIMAAHDVCRPYQISPLGKRIDVTLPRQLAVLYLTLGGRWKLRPLHGISGSVLLENNGTIHSHEGYHAPSGMWCVGTPLLSVPDRPLKDQAVDALHRLRTAMRTFTFKGSPLTRVSTINADVVDVTQPPGLCESAALTAMLTAVCRPSLPLAPGIMINAPSLSGSGAGKGLFARMITAIAFGTVAKAATAGHDEPELEKRIGASLLRGEPVILLDNLNNVLLRSAQLESCLTEPLVSVRMFGKLEFQDVRCAAVIIVTGNGVQASGDGVRRWLHATIEPPVDNPEQREYPTGFLDGIFSHRSELLSDCLTVWRWGRQQPDLKHGLPFGSYETWAEWVRDPLLALGCRDPAEGVQQARARDPMRINLTAIFAEWHVWHGSDWVRADDLHHAVRCLLDERERTASIRRKLAPLVNTRLGGFMLEGKIVGNARTAAAYYRMVEIKAPP